MTIDPVLTIELTGSSNKFAYLLVLMGAALAGKAGNGSLASFGRMSSRDNESNLSALTSGLSSLDGLVSEAVLVYFL